MLLVPFPYKCSAKAFSVAGPNHVAKQLLQPGSERGWGNFKVDPEHFEDQELDELCVALVRAAQDEVDSVNGIILPELAVEYLPFERICTSIKNDVEPHLEFAIAGARTNCEGKPGNHVLTGIWTDLEGDAAGANFCMISSRRKHHRWMLDASQIDAYGLSSSLDPRVMWWEDHICGSRELHFYPFREQTVFTSLICEDLARSDPCHEVLKSVGPNLVFSLLMDGPQISSRWPSRYASGLSDDVGSSVLTLTSYALIDRSNRADLHAHNETVAYFASPYGGREIRMPYEKGARGVLLSLTSEEVSRSETIDGRRKEQRAWRLASVRSLAPKY